MAGIDESTLRFIKELLPGFEPAIATRSFSDHFAVESISLPVAPAADYGFVVSFPGEWQIGAKTIEAPKGLYFWYRPY